MDETSLWGGLNICKEELYVKFKRSQEMGAFLQLVGKTEKRMGPTGKQRRAKIWGDH
jgi:hypothetical protein